MASPILCSRAPVGDIGANGGDLPASVSLRPLAPAVAFNASFWRELQRVRDLSLSARGPKNQEIDEALVSRGGRQCRECVAQGLQGVGHQYTA